MTNSSALKGAILNRLLVVGSVLGGFGLIAAGLYLGFWDAVSVLLEDPLNPDPAIEAVNLVVAVVLVVSGVVVWQVGKAYAQIQLNTPAGGSDESDQPAESPPSDGDDETAQKEIPQPDALTEINDRLEKIEADLEETRRGVRALQDAERTVSFEEGRRPDEEDAAAEPTGESSVGDEITMSASDGERDDSVDASESDGETDTSESDGETDESVANSDEPTV